MLQLSKKQPLSSSSNNKTHPRLILTVSPDTKPVSGFVVGVSCGPRHTLVCLKNGNVLSRGCFRKGKLGREKSSEVSEKIIMYVFSTTNTN